MNDNLPPCGYGVDVRKLKAAIIEPEYNEPGEPDDDYETPDDPFGQMLLWFEILLVKNGVYETP